MSKLANETPSYLNIPDVPSPIQNFVDWFYAIGVLLIVAHFVMKKFF